MLAGIMQELLNIANESDIDELSTVMETMIEMFGEEMAPFAVTLCTQLVGPLCFSPLLICCLTRPFFFLSLNLQRDSFLRMVTEAEGEDDENKMVSAMGMLRTIVTFVRMMDESTQILRQLEICFLPMMQLVLEEAMLGEFFLILFSLLPHGLISFVPSLLIASDYLEEVLEMISTFAYNSNGGISPALWSLLPVLHGCFKNGASDYFSEMLPCFENYISIDPKGFLSNPQGITLTLDVISSVSFS